MSIFVFISLCLPLSLSLSPLCLSISFLAFVCVRVCVCMCVCVCVCVCVCQFNTHLKFDKDGTPIVEFSWKRISTPTSTPLAVMDHTMPLEIQRCLFICLCARVCVYVCACMRASVHAYARVSTCAHTRRLYQTEKASECGLGNIQRQAACRSIPIGPGLALQNQSTNSPRTAMRC